MQVEEEIPSSSSNDDQNSASPDVTECESTCSVHEPVCVCVCAYVSLNSSTDLQYFSNYNDISKLVDPVSYYSTPPSLYIYKYCILC